MNKIINLIILTFWILFAIALVLSQVFDNHPDDQPVWDFLKILYFANPILVGIPTLYILADIWYLVITTKEKSLRDIAVLFVLAGCFLILVIDLCLRLI